jgi:type II secretory pathway pseudopilin PulG
MKRIISATRMLVASGVVAVALLAACGGDGPGKATSSVAPEQVDAAARARLEAQAQQYERSAHLQGQARTYGAPAKRPDAVRPNPIEAGNQAVAEQFERNAKLEGQARTYSRADSSDDAPARVDETSDDEFVPGSRHMPMR